jgi:DNA-binding transcriptional LysR family regulator
MSQLDLSHYRAFIMVAEEGNFRRAAERLHMTQPGITKAIKTIEGKLRQNLVIRRDGKGARLTQEGERFLILARQVVAADEAAQAMSTDDGSGGTLRVGHTAIAREAAVAAAAKLLDALPNLRIVMDEMPSKAIGVYLRDKRLDVGIVRDWVSRPGLLSAVVASAPLRLVVNAQHPRLANVTRIMSLHDIAGEHFVLNVPGEPKREALNEYFAKYRLAPPKVVMETNVMINAVRLIRVRPEVVTFLCVAGRHLDHVPGLQLVDLPEPPHHSTFLLWGAPEIRLPAAKKFATALREHLEGASREDSQTRGRGRS